jgi:hypothetical protein
VRPSSARKGKRVDPDAVRSTTRRSAKGRKAGALAVKPLFLDSEILQLISLVVLKSLVVAESGVHIIPAGESLRQVSLVAQDLCKGDLELGKPLIGIPDAVYRRHL